MKIQIKQCIGPHWYAESINFEFFAENDVDPRFYATAHGLVHKKDCVVVHEGRDVFVNGRWAKTIQEPAVPPAKPADGWIKIPLGGRPQAPCWTWDGHEVAFLWSGFAVGIIEHYMPYPIPAPPREPSVEERDADAAKQYIEAHCDLRYSCAADLAHIFLAGLAHARKELAK